MTPIDMTIKHEPPESIGDCFPCCIASILDLPRSDVPHIYADEGWIDETGKVGMRRLQDWLRPLGLYFMEFGVTVEAMPEWAPFLECHYVFSGKSPRGFRHSTVAFNGEVVHDPHPSREGVLPDDGVYSLGFLVRR